ncbi:cobalt-precorrin-4/precorrin-4 C(11)-methyltransferase [Kutzneria albida]|uniref:Uroporphyrin-III C/tetrapyrrole (Corrin/Porphyrin) methyltransferase n=1 Tax=Kutzneria albida DSM 43870 TaxID=1449976 RepID=W5W207_9PSEU|nr:cobalt-precorrin-4/precorrin-4 C(11)-methyltransferase [Kutzneria albida]AHH94830.1 Uroporphyrin-III C/tetrapyrrole (Corrin/Porphyrin) methyltransferase [Kutzneria albida DSM 43870]
MISFVGAGPGAADLMTFRGAARLARAEVVVWASSLIPAEVLEHANPSAERHDSAGMTLEDVLAVYARHPEAAIVRLHSGDTSVYGAIGEQIAWCRSTGREYEIVPGVGSLSAAAAAIGRELTAPGVAQSIVQTRLAGGRTAASMPAGESVAAFAGHRTTMAVYLSAQRPAQLQAELLAEGRGYAPGTPAVVVAKASWPDERVITTTVGGLAEDLAASGIRTAALVLVGDALGEIEPQRTRLYDPRYSHGCRRRSTEGSTEGRAIPVEKRRLP